MIATSVRDNLTTIAQAIDLLGAIREHHYTQRVSVCFNSTVGGHMRHVIEHYLSFFQGLETGEIDYESRPRNTLIESTPGYAVDQLMVIKQRLGKLAEENVDRSLRVRAETAPEDELAPWSKSTALRELEFLLSHTVHHYALIAVICRLVGQATPSDFGMAPSTLRYLKTQDAAACAH